MKSTLSGVKASAQARKRSVDRQRQCGERVFDVAGERGAKGGYRLRRSPRQIFLGAIVRTIDGPLAPFGDAESLRRLVARDKKHRAIYRLFLDVRNAAAPPPRRP